MKKKYIEMSVEELEKIIETLESNKIFFLFSFGLTGISGCLISIFFESLFIALPFALLSICFLIVVTIAILIKNHLSLLIYLKIVEALLR